MLVKQLFVCLVLVSVCDGLNVSLSNSNLCFTTLRLDIEANITSIRDYVNTQLTSLDELISYMSLKIDAQVNTTKALVTQLSNEALASNVSISHCVSGLKSLTKNLDMYTLSSCKCVPNDLEDLLLEAQNLSRSLSQIKTDCLLNINILNLVKVNLCVQTSYNESCTKAEALSEQISTLKEQILDDKLKCIEENYNIITSELCVLSCQFEECATTNCSSESNINLVSEVLNDTSILTEIVVNV